MDGRGGAAPWAAGGAPVLGQRGPRGEAYVGEPFGVARVEVDPSAEGTGGPRGLAAAAIEAKDGRALYPAVENRQVGEVIKGVLSQAKRPALRMLGQALDQPSKTDVYFLFRGSEPLELSLRSRRGERMTLPVVHDPARHQRLLAAWWRHYAASPILQSRADHPPVVENYLRAMLARRLGLRLNEEPGEAPWEEVLSEELRLAGETERLRLEYQRSQFLRPAAEEKADQPLPEAIRPGPWELAAQGDVAIEPIAMRVPEECLYVRFGSFVNFLWFQDTLARWGGDFQNLARTRGLDRGMREKIQEQLVVETTALSRLVGPQVVQDVAIIGTDLLFAEGGAYGLLFHVRNSLLFSTDTNARRRDRLKIGGVSETRVKLAGQEVSFLSSPDGHVRSYYVADGEFHFVTTSRTLAERFLQTREGKGSLGALAEFRQARSSMPLARGDAVFVYFSGRFFEYFVSPAYRIEMVRRMRAHADIELAELALLASAAEGKPGDTVEELAAGGFLPPRFGVRPDGSRTVIAGDEVSDSAARRARGIYADPRRGHLEGCAPRRPMPIGDLPNSTGRGGSGSTRSPWGWCGRSWRGSGKR